MIVALLAAIGLVSALVLIAYALARWRLLAPTSIRRALHAAVGAWTLAVTPYFHSLGWALVPPALFLIVNASSWARPLFRAIEGTPERAKGLWTFPAGVVLVYVLFWESGTRPAILAGLSALAFADPAAAIVGKRFGQRKYTRFGHGRTSGDGGRFHRRRSAACMRRSQPIGVAGRAFDAGQGSQCNRPRKHAGYRAFTHRCAPTRAVLTALPAAA